MTERVPDEAVIRDNLARIEESLCAACAAAGRRRDEVTLMAVTKTVPPERIRVALDAGITCVGENRVQEFLEKRDTLHRDGVSAHLIGHLQTNKVRRIVGEVDMIESVDSLHLAEAVARAARETERGCADVLVEVNIGGEESKTGIAVDQLDDLLGRLAGMPGIRVRGLMTIPPIRERESEKRAFFQQMYKLFIDKKGQNVDNISMDILSMGMSSDYTEAVKEGSTLVRIGSAIFGKRQYQ